MVAHDSGVNSVLGRWPVRAIRSLRGAAIEKPMEVSMFVLDRFSRKFANRPSAGEVKFQGPARDNHARRRASLLERLVDLVVGIRPTRGEGLDVGIARAVDEAFASLAREYRR